MHGSGGGWLHFIRFQIDQCGVRPLGVIARHDVLFCGLFFELLSNFSEMEKAGVFFFRGKNQIALY